MRIVTINTGKGDGAYRRRVELLTEGLRTLQPDVVCLQEALLASSDAGQRLDTAGLLASGLEMHVMAASSRRKVRLVEGQAVLSRSNVALLSRAAPLDWHAVDLPSDPADGERVALVARLADLTIGVVHLCHLRGADILRQQQLQTLMSDRLLANGGLVIGDLNTDLAGIPDLSSGLPDWSVADLWCGVGLGPRGTVPVSVPAETGRCLDYVLSVVPEGRAHPTVDAAALVLATPGADGLYPSDHRGVCVTLATRHGASSGSSAL
jgi:endonuclease/exonuclease/phosphatase family metal-dependent hydrolase